ncbi:uncharacterized protein Dvir_GJ18858 [Drosophila virilis]|uniref:Uncharacterized protein n=1 Tax=Drosophila virilis TaxID=7244 RepID=B4M1F9_DROVI|nr:uncharacterized protein Dvir_GJ18858 [Drosophila virilis]
MRNTCNWSNNRATTSRMSTSSLVWLLLLLCHGIKGQQLVYARGQRSLYGPPSLDWNTIGSFNPIGLGHMTKDELLTLLEAWQDADEDTKPPAPEPAEHAVPTAAPPERPAPAPTPAPGAPVTVRLPAFVPIQLSAMFTPPAPAGGAQGAAAPVDTGIALNIDNGAVGLDMVAQSNDRASPRLFRFMQLPMIAAQPRARSAQPPVARNTLESVDSGIAPLVQAKALSASDRPKDLPIVAVRQAPPVRPRFALPPFIANAPGPLELVPSSQIIGEWRE